MSCKPSKKTSIAKEIHSRPQVFLLGPLNDRGKDWEQWSIGIIRIVYIFLISSMLIENRMTCKAISKLLE